MVYTIGGSYNCQFCCGSCLDIISWPPAPLHPRPLSKVLPTFDPPSPLLPLGKCVTYAEWHWKMVEKGWGWRWWGWRNLKNYLSLLITRWKICRKWIFFILFDPFILLFNILKLHLIHIYSHLISKRFESFKLSISLDKNLDLIGCLAAFIQFRATQSFLSSVKISRTIKFTFYV